MKAADGSAKKGKKSKGTEELHVVGEMDDNILNQYKGVKGTTTPSKKNGDGLMLLDSLKPHETISKVITFLKEFYS